VSGAATAAVMEIPGEYDKSIQLSSVGDNSNPLVAFDLPSPLTHGTYEISWKVKIDNLTNTHYSLFFGNTLSQDMKWDDSLNNVFVAYQTYNVKWKPASAFPVQSGKWQEVKEIVDLDHKSYQVFIDGTMLRTNEGASSFTFTDDSL
jgi:hypothetical protein